MNPKTSILVIQAYKTRFACTIPDYVTCKEPSKVHITWHFITDLY